MSLAKRVVARPVTWLVVFSLIVGLGAYMITQLPVNQFPETEPPIIMVSCSYGETAPETVEQNVTRVLEGALANVTNMEEMTSTSSKGSARIVLSFTWGTDLAEATDDVRDSLERIRNSLPDGTGSPTIFKFDPSSMPILQLAVRGDRSMEELYGLATETIQAQIERIEGVATTSIRGGRERMVRVEVPQDRLEAYGVSLTEVASALARQNVEGSGGDITEGGRNYVVTSAGEFKSLGDIENTAVAYRGGQAVLLRDLTDVRWGYEDANSVVYVNGEPGIYIQVMKQSGSYSIEVADQVKQELRRINRQLPQGVELVTVMDTTSMIRNSISQVVSSAFYGVGFAVLVLLLFLRKIKTTLIVAIAIPVAILATVIGMYFLDISFNMVSLTGLILALGMVVDGSIVILENIYQYREKGSKLTTAAVLGSTEMTTAISASTLTTVCVFVPLMIFRNRLEMIGQLVKDLSFTVVIALLVSLGVATILIPVLASYALPVYTSRQRPVRNRLLRALDDGLAGAIRGLQKAYRGALRFVLRFRWLTVLAVFALLAWAFTLVPKVGFQFTPAARDDMVRLQVALPVGTPLEKTEEVVRRLEAIAREELVGYKNIISTAGGRGFFGGSSSGNSGSLLITLDLASGGDDSWSAQGKLRNHYGEFPDAAFSYRRFHGMGSSSDVEVSIYCSDLDRALDTADQIKQLIKENLPEVMEIEVDIDTGLPQVEVSIDRRKAFDLGVSISSVTAELEAAMAGTTATVYRSGGEEYDVLVILAEEDRSDFPDLQRVFTVTSGGQRVPLSSIATQAKTTGPVDISRENQKRVVHVTGSLPPGSKTNVIDARLRALVGENVVQDDELSVEFTGSMSELSETGGGLAVIAVMALILVFGVMASLFQSFKDPLIILFAIPLLFIGVILMYAWTGEPFSIFSGVGIVVLIGIVVNNGIVLVNYTNLLRSRGAKVREACIEAGVNRLRPILMTSLTTITAMIPMSFFPGAGSEQVKPIGITIIGGLTTSTLITLFLVPVLYSLFNEHRGKMKKGNPQ
jgi:HAE1 family hydrophobic/amphiphilic exporter-1